VTRCRLNDFSDGSTGSGTISPTGHEARDSGASNKRTQTTSNTDPPGGAATGGTVDGWVVVAGGTATGADDVGGRGDGSSEHSGLSCQLSSAGDGRGAGQSIVIKRGMRFSGQACRRSARGRSKLSWHV